MADAFRFSNVPAFSSKPVFPPEPAFPSNAPGTGADLLRPVPLDWRRSRREERDTRRADAAHRRAAARMQSLGMDWRVLDLQATAGADRMRFLALGPGGVFAVTVKDHGRSRVNFAGDVVSIGGRRLPYVPEARRNAESTATALTRGARVAVPVMPVLAFAGSGVITAYGMPRGIIVTAYGELSQVLNARGQRLAPYTVEKLHRLAADPDIWINEPYVGLAQRYQWYPEGTGSTDKARR